MNHHTKLIYFLRAVAGNGPTQVRWVENPDGPGVVPQLRCTDCPAWLQDPWFDSFGNPYCHQCYAIF